MLNNYWTPLSDRNQRDEDFQIKKRLPQVWVGCRLTDKTSSKAKPNRHITGHSERRMSGFRHRPRHVRSSTRSCKARGRVANSVGVWRRSEWVGAVAVIIAVHKHFTPFSELRNLRQITPVAAIELFKRFGLPCK